MADIFWPNRVLYNCSCNLASPFTHLYFCRYCAEVRCQLCVYHEIDSYFCPNCLENMPSAEAKLKKNRCANCYECPSCGNTLSTRATAVAIESDNPEEKATAKKVFYLACGFCRWSTRDVGIADRSNASSGWQEPENPISKRVNNLVDYYRKLAFREKYEREKTKLRKKSYLHIASPSSFSMKSKTGNLGLLKKRSSLSLLKSLSISRGNDSDEEISFSEPAVATEQPPRQSLYTEVVQLDKAASISQMLAQPDFQHSQTCDFHPRHKHLIAKRSQRCRQCEHNLCKPEFNPSSTKYKIQLFAINYIPQLQVSQVPELHFGKKSRVTVSLKNPSDHVVTVTLKTAHVSTDGAEETELGEKLDSIKAKTEPSDGSNKGNEKEQLDERVIEEQKEIKKEGQGQRSGEEILEKTMAAKQLKIPVDNSADNKILEDTAELILPASPLLLAAKDDAAEYDENELAVAKLDDPNVVASRQANKLWFYIDVTPSKPSGDVQFSLILKYDFKTVPSTISKVGTKEILDEPREAKMVQLEQLVRLNLGKVAASDE